MSVYGLDGSEEERIGRQFPARPSTQISDLRGQASGPRGAVSTFEGPLHGGCQERGQFFDDSRFFRTYVEFRAGAGWNGIDAGAAFDHAEVVGARGFAMGSRPVLGRVNEGRDGVAQSMYGVGRSLVVPVVAAASGKCDLITLAGERLRSDVVDGGAVQYDKRFNLRDILRDRKSVV